MTSREYEAPPRIRPQYPENGPHHNSAQPNESAPTPIPILPVLPRRLTYPELVPPQHHEDCLYEDFDGLTTRLRWALKHTDQAHALAAKLRPAAARFDWAEMGPRYDEAMTALSAIG